MSDNFDTLKAQKDAIEQRQKDEAMSTLDTIERLRQSGSSLAMNWGEDTGLWECSLITGGNRFTERGSTLSATISRLARQLDGGLCGAPCMVNDCGKPATRNMYCGDHQVTPLAVEAA